MLFINTILLAVVSALISAAPDNLERKANDLQVPSLNVPACPATGTVYYNTSLPSTDNTTFPKTQVDLCYEDAKIRITFTGWQEESFYYNQSVPLNGDIYDYEVMESFIHLGTSNPSTYLEFEVAPNNQTFSAFIYNPSKLRATGAAFDRFYITDLAADELVAFTAIDTASKMWECQVEIPLKFFNVEDGCAKGTQWRMNFFRTTTSAETFPVQKYGGWSAPNETNFHMTPFFGNVLFV